MTVNTAEQVLSASQVEVTVHVTVLEPPHAGGAAPPLFEIAALQPPEKVAELSHVVYLPSIAACVWHEASVWFAGHVRTTAGAAVTVNTAEQVLFASQLEVTVQVTVVDPPHAGGAPVLLFVIAASQPPLKLAVFSHAVKAVLIAVCV